MEVETTAGARIKQLVQRRRFEAPRRAGIQIQRAGGSIDHTEDRRRAAVSNFAAVIAVAGSDVVVVDVKLDTAVAYSCRDPQPFELPFCLCIGVEARHRVDFIAPQPALYADQTADEILVPLPIVDRSIVTDTSGAG